MYRVKKMSYPAKAGRAKHNFANRPVSRPPGTQTVGAQARTAPIRCIPRPTRSVRVEIGLHSPERIPDGRETAEMFPALAHAAVTPDQERPELGGRQLAFAVGLVSLENTEKQLPHLAIVGEQPASTRAVGALVTGPGRIGEEHIGEHVEQVAVGRVHKPPNILQPPLVVSVVIEPFQEALAVIRVRPDRTKLILVGDQSSQIAEQAPQELGGRDRLAVRAPIGRRGVGDTGPS